jgi:hypothetical protein
MTRHHHCGWLLSTNTFSDHHDLSAAFFWVSIRGWKALSILLTSTRRRMKESKDWPLMA